MVKGRACTSCELCTAHQGRLGSGEVNRRRGQTKDAFGQNLGKLLCFCMLDLKGGRDKVTDADVQLSTPTKGSADGRV